MIRKLWVAAFAAIMLAVGGFGIAAPAGADQSALQDATLYPRVIRVAKSTAGINGRLLTATLSGIYQSSDEGVTWSFRGNIPVPSGTTERCCGTIYELPQAVGSLPAGTLLYAATYHFGSTTSIRVYRSTDAINWTAHSTLVDGGTFGSGVWEPQFDVANNGALVAFWSDETNSCCSQRLMRARSTNGTTWIDKGELVRSTIQGDRPGMITTSKLPNGSRFMTHELCGPAGCTVFYKTSTDGWNYGTTTAMGNRIETYSGQYLAHAPTNAWSPLATSSNGAILVVGQLVFEGNGTTSALNGQAVLVNTTADGSGKWYAIPSPVSIPSAYDNYCPNYSSSLLPATNGSTLLEVASAYQGTTCRAFVGRYSWNQQPNSGSTYVLRSDQATSQCLDNTGWSTQNNTKAELWDCNGAPVQRWTTTSLGNGYFTVKNQQTGLCLDNTGGSVNSGNLLTLWACDNGANQQWQFVSLGNNHFRLRAKSSAALVMSVPSGGGGAGTHLTAGTDTGVAAHSWLLQ